MRHISFDNDSLTEDLDSKSAAFFSKNEPSYCSKEALSKLIEIGQERKTNSRICMHPNPEANMHEMLIYQTQDNYFPPKKQLTKEKSFLVLEGRIALCIFEETGVLKNYVILEKSSNFFCRVPSNYIHMDLTISEFSVHLESVPGPYKKEDCEFPDWYDPKKKMEFLSGLREQLK